MMTCLGVAKGGQLVNVNADSATRALVDALQPLKIIFLSGVGGLLGEDDKPIHSINLAADYDELMDQPHVHSGMKLKLQEIKRLLDKAPLSSSVSITSPAGLIQELFTHGGSGTLIRRGELIFSSSDKAAIDSAKLTQLVEGAFARKLHADWWSPLSVHAVHLSESCLLYTSDAADE